MNTLALDIAYNCGWAMCVDGKAVYGSLDLHPFKHDRGELLHEFSEWLRGQIWGHKIEMLVLEPAFGSSPNVHHIIAMVWLSELICADHGIQRRFYKASEWRKALLGRNPRRSLEAKKAVKAWCEDAGFKPANYDEADAIGLLSVAMRDRVRVTVE